MKTHALEWGPAAASALQTQALATAKPDAATRAVPGRAPVRTALADVAFILPFDFPDATLATVGGKGMNLGLMTRASFPVPPELLAQHLAAASQGKITPDERLASARREREAAERLVHALRGARGFLARRLLKVGQSHAAHVDDSVFHFQRVLALVRATFLEAGQWLARAGVIERAADVFYMERSEVWAPPDALAGRVTVTQRRLLRERRKRLAPPPSIPPLADSIWSADRMMKMTTSAGAHERDGRRVLLGTPASPGRAKGIARVIAGPGDFQRFQPGDVLVAHTTTPVWTPLFNIASAAVTEVGGPFSHAAIVAREFGIPLVTGAIDATHVVTDGVSVVVDGSAGMVEL